ncbi:phosphopantetheine-binding protein [Actinokineospora spheciospongiae]|uniref:phosphopantetheine-binding protein n=1 Tax=Actinokineospora spheciospongiae TaxID=909613 RepID=UPI000D70F6A5|nr:phosphopantetheine-binding protein [Actinokineospora spheciospongiae]PWW59481.1 acyl carrier protein [Actinokineospora spheciospongiae]
MSNVDTIKSFIIEEFLPDVEPAALAADYDLLANGVIDSLGLLKLIAWIEDRFSAPIADDDLDPDNFRSVTAIDTFVARVTAGAVTGS